jgi:hypothetical protein
LSELGSTAFTPGSTAFTLGSTEFMLSRLFVKFLCSMQQMPVLVKCKEGVGAGVRVGERVGV